MSFTDAIRTGFQKYVTFDGRARRSEFWYWFLFTVLVSIVAQIIDRALFKTTSTSGPVQGIAGLALLLPGLAVGCRRLHDTNRSGWWQLLQLIPLVGIIILIVWWVQDSKAENKYGPSPKMVGSVDPGQR